MFPDEELTIKQHQTGISFFFVNFFIMYIFLFYKETKQLHIIYLQHIKHTPAGEVTIQDVWKCLREGEEGFTYDCKKNGQISDSYQSRLDRVFTRSNNLFVCYSISLYLYLFFY